MNIELEITVARPREEVFAYLSDIANHPEFMDHYLVDWRMLRVDTVGKGAGGRFRLNTRRRFMWGDLTFVDVVEPRLIRAAGRGGKYNRTKLFVEWTLEPAGPSGTRVGLMIDTEPQLPSDKLNEALGLTSWMKRRSTRALKRMRDILEADEARGRRATVGGLSAH